jgi:pimeloyl-ACP methyl ester carboxylesterase
MDMDRVISKDGTSIAYERQGSGPSVILVGGGLVDRSENAPLAAELARSFITYNYDRRGRAESGDTLPYSVEREIEDIEALIGEAGGSAHLYGVSSGGALVLEAAAAGVAAERLAVYEVPYQTDEGFEKAWRAYVEELNATLAAGHRSQAVELFMRMVGTSDEIIEGAKASEHWAGAEALAHTLAYDAACIGEGPPPTERLATIRQPTLVATGDVAPDPDYMGATPLDFFGRAADAIVAAIPNAERVTLEGQWHMVDAKVLAPVLERFFAA